MDSESNFSKCYDVALRNTYDELYEMNITKNSYRLVYGLKGKFVMPAGEGCASDTVAYIAQHMVYPDDAQRFLQFLEIAALREKLRTCDSVTEEFRKLRQDGTYRWASLLVVPFSDASGDEMLHIYVMDVDEKRRARVLEQQNALLRQSELDAQRQQLVVDRVKMVIMEWNIEQNLFYFSSGVSEFTFIKRITRGFERLHISYLDIHPEDWAEVRPVAHRLLDGVDDVELTVRLRRQDGAYLWCRCTATVLSRKHGRIMRLMVTVSDTDTLVRAQRALAYRAAFDPLTGYSNFDSFKRDVKAILGTKGSKKYSLWYCDLKNFKYINDIYGYDIGDQLLRFWSDVFAHSLREGEAFARINADNFTALRFYDEEAELEQRFQKELLRLQAFEALKNKRFLVELVCGVYCIERECDLLSVEDMIDRANMAQKSVKLQPGSRFALYSEKMRSQFILGKSMEAEMAQALKNREFSVYLQGQVDIQRRNVVCGAEALVRWIHPVRGLVPPVEFIPLFEKNGFIVELDCFVFEEVCRYLAVRNQRGERLFKIAVNASRLTLLQPDFLARYTHIKQHYHIPNNLLEIECTETVLIENLRAIGDVAARLRENGFLVGMDDFGSGYSSLNVLKDVVVDVLKIDMEFFQNGLTKERDRAIVSSIVAMAGALEMVVVAEGVESMEQVSFLRQIGCDIVQGYVFCKPVPIDAFRADQPFATDDATQLRYMIPSRDGAAGLNALLNQTVLCGVVEYDDDAAMTVRYISPEVAELLGCTQLEAPQRFRQGICTQLHEDDVAMVAERLLCRSPVPSQLIMEYRLLGGDGSVHWIEDRRFCIADGQKRCISVLTDITLERHFEKNSLRNAGRLQTLLDQMSEAVCIFEFVGVIRPLYMNKRFYEMFGYSEEDYWRKRAGNILANAVPQDAQEVLRLLRLAVEEHAGFEYTLRLQRHVEGTMQIALNVTQLPETQALHPVFLVLLQDVTNRDKTSEQLQMIVQQQQTLLNKLPVGVIVFEAGEILKIKYLSNGVYRLLGEREFAGRIGPGTDLADAIYPQVRAEFCDKVRVCVEQNAEFEMVYPSRRGATMGWSLAHGRLLEHPPGEPALLCLVVMDITPQKQAELQLKIQAERYGMLEETLQEILFDYDILNDCMIITHRADGELIRERIEHFVEKNQQSIKIPRVYSAVNERHFLEACKTPKRMTFDVPVRNEYGEYRWHRVILSSVAQEQGMMVHVVGRAFDVHQETQERMAAEERAMRDQLTGLYNKISGEMKVRRLLQECRPGALSVMMMVDLDGFKQVNDCFGHAFGDEVLMRSAQILREVFSDEAVMIRFGGDELIIFMQTSDDCVGEMARTFQKNLIGWKNGKCEIRCSIGIVLSDSRDFKTLFHMADSAMYQAKTDGKNRIAIYNERTGLRECL